MAADTPARRSRSALFLKGGFDVEEASDGIDVRQWAAATQPDLILFELLAHAQILHVCQTLKSEPQTAGIPVIEISPPGEGLPDLPPGPTRGADVYLQAPVNPDSLLAVAGRLVRATRGLRKLKTLCGTRRPAVRAAAAAQTGSVPHMHPPAAERHRDEMLAAVMESTPSLLIILDRRGVVSSASKSANEILGIPAERLVGVNLAEKIVSYGFSAVEGSPPIAEVCASLIHSMLAGVAVANTECQARRADGTAFTVLLDAVPLRRGDGAGGLLIGRDISKRKAAEEELRRSQERYRQFIDLIPEGVWRWDFDPPIPVHLTISAQAERLVASGRLGMCNSTYARYVGSNRPEDLVGHNIVETGIGTREEHVKRATEFIRRGYRMEDFEYTTGAGESLRFFRKNAFGVIKDDCLTSMWGTWQDVTARRQAELDLKRLGEDLESKTAELQELNRRLLESNADLQQFAGMVAHDLQSPLNAVMLVADELAQALRSGAQGESIDCLGSIVNSVRRMQRLIRNVLDYSKVEGGSRSFVAVDCNEVVQRAIEALAGEIRASGSVVTADSLPTVQANPEQMAAVFQNLIGNGIKYRKRSSVAHVHVSAVQAENEWLFTIRDDGIGIPVIDQRRIFRIFERLGRKGDSEGAGIGLAICQRVIERHGGRIWVDSEAGGGSEFRFTLPLTAQPESD